VKNVILTRFIRYVH